MARLQRGFLSVAQNPLYVTLSFLMAVIAVVGFAPDSVHQLVEGRLPTDKIIHVHAAVFTLWLGLFFMQTLSAATGNMFLHRKLGVFLMGYGALMYGLGLSVTINRFVKGVHAGDILVAEKINLAPITDMVAFPIFFVAALIYVKKPEVHKRLMIVTATLLLYAAVARMTFLQFHHSFPVFLLVWAAPVLLGVIHDWHKDRKLHPAYAAGLLVMFILSLRPFIVETSGWLKIASWCVNQV